MVTELNPSIAGATSEETREQDEELRLRLPQRSILADDVYGIIRDGLISRRIEPGSRLNLDNLARELHVSNTPVRQALARLESEGLVTKEPYRGFAASRLLDSRTIIELYEYRLILEPPTAARASRHAGERGVADLERLCDSDEIHRLIDTGAVEELAQRDVDFHCGVARLADNSVVLDNLSHTLTRMRLYTTYDRTGAGLSAWDEHRAIVDAIVAQDPREAAEKMREHLKDAFERMKRTA